MTMTMTILRLFFSQHLFQKTKFSSINMQGTRSSFLIKIFNTAVKTRWQIHKKKWLIDGNLRERCMDLVSFESPQEYRHFATMMYYGELLLCLRGKITLKLEIIKIKSWWKTQRPQHIVQQSILTDNVSSIHTSGRKCNFQNKGCDAAHLQPININGWAGKEFS